MSREEVFNRLLKINRYHRAGRHSAVKPCHRAVEALKNRRFCYKYRFYGIPSHRCIQMSPTPIRCTHRCVFCRRAHPEELGASGEPPVPDKRDDPETIVEESIKAHRQALSGYNPKANPKVLPGMREEAMNPTHAAISLAGEPLLYPYIDELVAEYRKRGFTTFIVSNGTLPRVLARMSAYPHQMYVSVTAPNERLYKLINRPIVRDGRKRYLEFLEIMRDLPTLTVMRFTIIKGLNDARNYVREYAKLVELAEPTYVEIKGYSYVGYSQYRMKPENQPSMDEIREFAKLLASELGGYGIADEHKPSRIVLVTRLPYSVKLQANRRRDEYEAWKDVERIFFMRILVHVKPNSREFRVEKLSETERIVYVRSPPIKGRANEELVKGLRKLLKRRVRIISGHASRTKVIEIERNMYVELYISGESAAAGRLAIRALVFTYPVIRAATELLSCRRGRCDYVAAIEPYRREAYVAFEVVTRNVFVGLKEPAFGGGSDSRAYNSELRDASRELPEDPVEYVREAVRVARKLEYEPLKRRLGTHEARRLGLGDCEEYVDVLASLLAARGIPYRRVVGITPGGLHARLEYKASDGSRVPIDPTRNEVGRLSRPHVPIFFGSKRPIKAPKNSKIARLDVRLMMIPSQADA